MILFFLACATTNDGWTEEAAYATVRARLDQDEDGHVDLQEWVRVAWAAPVYHQVDTNADGDLDNAELGTLILTEDPASFFEPADRPHDYAPDLVTHRVRNTVAWLTLEALRQELEAATRGQAVAEGLLPDEAHLEAIAAAGLTSPEATALLSRWVVAFEAAGLTFPPALLPSVHGVAPPPPHGGSSSTAPGGVPPERALR